MKVAIVAEFYPRAADPVLGLWAHRQAIAARDAGADVRVLVLHRPLPSRAQARAGARQAVRATAAARSYPAPTGVVWSTGVASTIPARQPCSRTIAPQ